MNKKMKKLIVFVLSAVMLMALNITVFADDTTYYDVTFCFYQRDSTAANPVNTQVYDNITVSVPEGTTYKDALDDALAQEALAAGTDFYATWVGGNLENFTLDIEAITLDDITYTNNYMTIGNFYMGTVWLWDYDLTIDGDYPYNYPINCVDGKMSERIIHDNTTIYMIFETASYSA